MVASATDSHNLTSRCVYQLTYVGVYALKVFLTNQWACALDVEHEVKVYLA